MTAGTGLTGGATSGDVGVALDLPYTDARYANIVHGHAVSAISGAATLGGNTFNGAQTIDNGNLSLDLSTAATGTITKNGARFVHDFGTRNTVTTRGVTTWPSASQLARMRPAPTTSSSGPTSSAGL